MCSPQMLCNFPSVVKCIIFNTGSSWDYLYCFCLPRINFPFPVNSFWFPLGEPPFPCELIRLPSEVEYVTQTSTLSPRSTYQRINSEIDKWKGLEKLGISLVWVTVLGRPVNQLDSVKVNPATSQSYARKWT